MKNNKEFKKKLQQIKYLGKNNKYLEYDFLEFLVKDGVDYKSLMAQVSQQVLRLLDKNWISFFESIKDWSKHKDKYTGRPKLPKYLNKNGRNIIIFTNQNAVQKNNIVQLPKCLNKYELNTKINGVLQQVRILPRNKYFVLEVVYNQEKPKQLQDNDKYISIDIGLDNLATITNNCNIEPVIMSGKKLKSINKYYNKELSHYREIAKRMNNLDWTNKMNRLTIKRNNMITDLMHKASKSVLKYALSCGANTIVIGNNKDWKRESSMSKKVNQ
jgi:putative transposase